MIALPEKRFYLFTDSGGPYFRARKSLIQLAKLTGRPLVPVRHFAVGSKKFNGHQIQLAEMIIRTAIGSPITCNELEHFSEKEALVRLQQGIDVLAKLRKIGT